jgi:hypothetical protein
VRESLKVKKNFQNQIKFFERISNPEGLSGYPEDSEVHKSEKRQSRENGHRKFKKPKTR